MSENIDTLGVQEERSAYKSFPFFRILYRNWILIVCIIVLTSVLGTAYAFYSQKPVYTAEGAVIFNVRIQNVSETAAASFAKNFMPTVASTITTPDVEKKAQAKVGGRGISRGAVTVDYTTDSLIMHIKYSASTEAQAKSCLKAYIEATSEVLSEKRPIPVQDMSLKEIQHEYFVSVSSSRSTFIFVGVIAGIVLGVVVAVLRYLLDNKLKDKSEIEEIVGASLLSYIDKQ